MLPVRAPRSVTAASALALLVALVAPLPAAALGDAALLYVAPSDLTVSYDGLRFHLEGAGASRVDVTGSWPAGTDLGAEYRLVVITPYGGPLEPAVGDDLAAFVSHGGGLVVMAEHYFGDEAGNALAERLGLGARFHVTDTGGGCASTDVSAPSHPLTEGAPTLEFAWSRTVTGGTLLYGTAAPIVTLDGTVVLAGDSDVFSDPVAFGGCPVGPSTERFYENLFTALPDEGGGPAADAGVPDAGPVPGDGGSAGGLGAACAVNEDCTSGICASDGSRSYCTELCTTTCAPGYECQSAGALSVCAPVATGGGCQAGRRSAAPLPLTFALLAFAASLALAGRRT